MRTTSSTLPSTSAVNRHRFGVTIALTALALTSSAAFAAPGTSADSAEAADQTETTSSTLVDDATNTTTTTTTTTTNTTSTATTTTTTPANSTTIPAQSPKTVATVPTTTSAAPAPTTSTTVAPTALNVRVYPGELGNILATIRYMESRGQYGIAPNKGNASGAYQFIASTWANYGGYPHAYLAPPAVQDERAAQDVTMILEKWNNDVSMVPVIWYYPRAATDPALMDVVPVPSAGNTLTIRQYQQRWLATFSTISGEPVPTFTPSMLDSLLTLGLAPTPPERDDGLPSIEFPVIGPSTIAAPDCHGDESNTDPDAAASVADIEAAGLCTDAAPSIVFGVKLQPVRAVVDGIVTAIDDEPGSGRPISVTITEPSGRSYVYAGFNDDRPGTSDGNAPDHLRLTSLAVVGTTVWAGQIIGFMGDTDPIPVGVRGQVATDASVHLDPDAIAPHIRLSIHEIDGTPVDAFGPVIDSQSRTSCSVGIGRWSVPPRSATTEAVTIETTDNDDNIDSEWIITSTGQVHASGWAALVNPGESCEWAPYSHYGPGALGYDDSPARWTDGLVLSTDVWLQVALNGNGNDTATSPLFRF